MRSPASRASYSASLFVLVKFNRRSYVNSTPLGLIRTKPALNPLLFDAPSVKGVHLSTSSLFGNLGGNQKNSLVGVLTGAFDKKSARTCPFMVFLSSNTAFTASVAAATYTYSVSSFTGVVSNDNSTMTFSSLGTPFLRFQSSGDFMSVIALVFFGLARIPSERLSNVLAMSAIRTFSSLLLMTVSSTYASSACLGSCRTQFSLCRPEPSTPDGIPYTHLERICFPLLLPADPGAYSAESSRWCNVLSLYYSHTICLDFLSWVGAALALVAAGSAVVLRLIFP
ncbi:hypothetical protein Tco_1028760 [Tanacetum coccineum]|uniref:Uncharacterized protein n=1 Tax=Tanacetum coccineum TaxID=301880 RepID=A0ABQ5G1J0_9ASTR